MCYFRYTHTEYIAYTSKTPPDSDQLEFELEKRDPPQVYLFGDMLLKVTVGIVKADGRTLPDATARVALVNNSMNSLFSTLFMGIAGQEVA